MLCSSKCYHPEECESGKEKVKFWMLYQWLTSINPRARKEKVKPGRSGHSVPDGHLLSRAKIIPSLRPVLQCSASAAKWSSGKVMSHLCAPKKDATSRQNTTNRDIVSHLLLDGADTSPSVGICARRYTIKFHTFLQLNRIHKLYKKKHHVQGPLIRSILSWLPQELEPTSPWRIQQF